MNVSTNLFTCGNVTSSGVVTPTDSSNGNLKLSIIFTPPTTPTTHTLYPTYLYIGQPIGGYGGTIGGGLKN